MLYGGKVDLGNASDPLSIIASMITPRTKLLDVGCGVGNFARFLSEQKGCVVTGVELSPVMAEIAGNGCRRVIVGDIEQAETMRQLLADGPYDYVVCADVLEHLVDPWKALEAMHSLLLPRGHVLLSLPNVAHWSVRVKLASGRFDYTPGFLLDRTHLRFFTQSSARRLVAEGGFAIERELIRWAPLPGDRFWRKAGPVRDLANGALARALPNLFGYQFVYSLVEGTP